ncbi:hypothetical protein PCI56_01115 [Plesiomonas shigelloides subsp. oncorhynchi]|nr:hypothetical protein [Plesiomonas shigelloides]
MRSDSINRIMYKYTLSGSDFSAKRAHWTLKAVAVFVIVSAFVAASL